MSKQILFCTALILAMSGCGSSKDGDSSANNKGSKPRSEPTGTFSVSQDQSGAESFKICGDGDDYRYGIDPRLKIGQWFDVKQTDLNEYGSYMDMASGKRTVVKVDHQKNTISWKTDMQLGAEKGWYVSNCAYNSKDSSYRCELGEASANLKTTRASGDDVIYMKHCYVDVNLEKMKDLTQVGEYTFPDGKKVSAVWIESSGQGTLRCHDSRTNKEIVLGDGERRSLKILSQEIADVDLSCGGPGKIFEYEESILTSKKSTEMLRSFEVTAFGEK